MAQLNKYFGFAINGQKVIKIFEDAGTLRAFPSSLSDLDGLERSALDCDISPTSFYYEDVAALAKGSDIVKILYAHGKDLTPFKPLEYIKMLDARKRNPSMAPIILNLQLEQTCNDSCTFCSTRDTRLHNPVFKGKKFSLSQTKQLIDYMADNGGKLIEIIGSGEGTNHPDFLEILNYLGQKGLMLSLYTNGKNFAQKNGLNTPLLDALSQYAALLNVSLDGLSHRHEIHRGASRSITEKIYEGLDYISEHRDKSKVGIYNSFTLSSGIGEPNNFVDLRECIERQIGRVEAMHIQSNFHTNSHRLIDPKLGHDLIQGIIDDFSGRMYLYFNYPVIDHFSLNLFYENSCNNVAVPSGIECFRGLLYPSVESGSNGAWPCYVGNCTATQSQEFSDILTRLESIRSSSDHKQALECNPCINSSFNRFFWEYNEHEKSNPGAEYFTLYKRKNIEGSFGVVRK